MSGTAAEPPPAAVSVHDVMPHTLERVEEILEAIRPWTGDRIALLVVPGLAWTAAGVDRLRRWEDQGLELAGHGWVHYGKPKSFYHRLHGLVISRDQAEHLSLSGAQITALIDRGLNWFRDQGLRTPRFYVPPAWALGRIGPERLRETPYRWCEVLQGYLDVVSGRLLRCPLVGFEADTLVRKWALKPFNALSVARARSRRRPLRIGFHPFDLGYHLAEDALASVKLGWRFLTTEEAVEALSPPGYTGT